MALALTAQKFPDDSGPPSAEALPVVAGRWVAVGLASPPSSQRLWESGAIGLYYALVSLPAGGRWLPGLLELPGLSLGRAVAAYVPVAPERIDAWLDVLAEEGLVALDRAAGLVYLPGLVRHGVPGNKNTVAAIARQWQRVKGSELAQRAARDLVAAAEHAEPGRDQRRRGKGWPAASLLERLRWVLGIRTEDQDPAQQELEIPTPAARPRLRVVDRFAGPDHRLGQEHAEKSQAREGDAVQRQNHGASLREVHMEQHTLPFGGAAAGDKSAAPSLGLEGADDETELRPKRIINGVVVDPGNWSRVGAQAGHSVQPSRGEPAQVGRFGGGASASGQDRGRLGVLPPSGDGRRAADGDAPTRTAELSARLPARGFAAAWNAAAARCPALRAARPALTTTGLSGDAENRLARWWLDNPQYEAADLLTLVDWLKAGGDRTLKFGGRTVLAALCDGKLGTSLESAIAWHNQGRPRISSGHAVKSGIMVYDGGKR